VARAVEKRIGGPTLADLAGGGKRGVCGPRASRKNQCRWVGGSLVMAS
jgi:hypothetical protein